MRDKGPQPVGGGFLRYPRLWSAIRITCAGISLGFFTSAAVPINIIGGRELAEKSIDENLGRFHHIATCESGLFLTPLGVNHQPLQYHLILNDKSS